MAYKLNLKMINNNKSDCFVRINGKDYTGKKNSFDNKIISFESETDEIELEIFTLHELEGRLWYIPFIIFFIISIFGIFSPKYNKNFYSIKFKEKIKLNEITNIDVIVAPVREGTIALKSRGDILLENNETNKYVKNAEIQKRLKIVKFVKLFTWLAIILSIILFIVIKIKN